MRKSDRVGVRELRQNLSVYLRRVKDGETLEVTERGHKIAKLTRLRETSSPLERLRADGKVIRASMTLSDLPIPLPRGARPLSKTIEELREEPLH